MIWDTAGPANTVETLKLAMARARDEGIKWLVVASNTGDTVRKALELGAEGLSIVCVTHHVGYPTPGKDDMSTEAREYLASQGVKVLTTTHVLAGIDGACASSSRPLSAGDHGGGALRMLGQGGRCAWRSP